MVMMMLLMLLLMMLQSVGKCVRYWLWAVQLALVKGRCNPCVSRCRQWPVVNRDPCKD